MEQSVEAFLDEVKVSVRNQLKETVKEINQELVKLSTQKGHEKNATPAKIDEGCEELHDRLNKIFGENMKKFGLYSQRNVFSGVLDNKSGSSASSDAELAALREKYLEVHSEYCRLTLECADYAVLLKDMRNALFQLRVSAQVFDDYSVMPLADTVAQVTQQRANLEEMCAKATELLDKIQPQQKEKEKEKEPHAGRKKRPSEAMAGDVDDTEEQPEQGQEARSIKVGSIDDLNVVTRNVTTK